MTEEDISILVTSIDENGIEIIPSNDSEIDDQLTFVPDHFSIHNRSVNPPVASIQPVHPTIRLNRQESEVIQENTNIYIYIYIYIKLIFLFHFSIQFLFLFFTGI